MTDIITMNTPDIENFWSTHNEQEVTKELIRLNKVIDRWHEEDAKEIKEAWET